MAWTRCVFFCSWGSQGILHITRAATAHEPLCALSQDLLAMVPQPVKALIMCFPITDETDAAAAKGECAAPPDGSPWVSPLAPAQGVALLVRACAEDEEVARAGKPVPGDLFYLKQTIGNACGTIAVLHSICNNQADFPLGAPPRCCGQLAAWRVAGTVGAQACTTHSLPCRSWCRRSRRQLPEPVHRGDQRHGRGDAGPVPGAAPRGRARH